MLLAAMGGLATLVIWGRDTFCMYWPLIMGGGPPGPIAAMGGIPPGPIIDMGGGPPMPIDDMGGGPPIGGPPIIGGADAYGPGAAPIGIICGGIVLY